MALTRELLDALRFALPVFTSWSFIYSTYSVKSRQHPENLSLGLPFLNVSEQVEKIRCTSAGPTAASKMGCTVSQAHPKGWRVPTASRTPGTWYWEKENVGLRENLSQAFHFLGECVHLLPLPSCPLFCLMWLPLSSVLPGGIGHLYWIVYLRRIKLWGKKCQSCGFQVTRGD